MEAKESLIKVLKALQELDRPIARQSLIDFLAGKETEESIKGNWDDMETYGIGDTHEEEYWNTVIDAAIEKKHEERYRALLQNVETAKVFEKSEVKVWECRNCGHIIVGTKAPEICPVCAHPQAYFEVHAENY